MNYAKATILIPILFLLLNCSNSEKEIRQREASLRDILKTTRETLDIYFSDKGKYPHSLDELVNSGYLKKVPVDPITGSAKTWVLSYEDVDQLKTPGPGGIWDVKSGALGVTADGIPYSDL